MNKYQEAIENIGCLAEQHEGLGSDDLLKVRKQGDLLQELADRADEEFTHILHVRNGYPARIAFHTSKEAEEYAAKHDLRHCHLESIQFGKMDEE